MTTIAQLRELADRAAARGDALDDAGLHDQAEFSWGQADAYLNVMDDMINDLAEIVTKL